MHLFIYQLKTLSRDKVLLFWTFLFPLILATFFNMAFSKLTSSEGFEAAKVAVIVEKQNKEFTQLLDDLSQDNDDQLLDVQYTSLVTAKDLLDNDKIDAYLVIDDDFQITVLENGISQTIIQSVVDSYQQMTHSLSTIAKVDSQSFLKLVQREINMNQDYFKSQNISSINATVVYFYTLVGMTCMYGGFWGLKVSTNIEANLSRKGTRVNVSPTSKLKLILIGDFVSFLIQYLSLILLLVYLLFGLGVDFGNQTGYILLLMAIGSYVGVAVGNLIGNLLHCSENTKVSILSSSSLFLSFLSGMMIIDMKYWIQEYIPLLAKLNPVSLITDALYALYYYPTYERFFTNIAILLAIGIVLTLGATLLSRRKKYASL